MIKVTMEQGKITASGHAGYDDGVEHIRSRKIPIHNPKVKPEATIPPAFTMLRVNSVIFFNTDPRNFRRVDFCQISFHYKCT